jgi:MoxR-like ATPase
MANLPNGLADAHSKLLQITQAVSSVVIGQEDLVQLILIAGVSRGHALVEGLPGLAKTLTISTFASCISGDFARIQFTPDLLPADLTGTMVFDPRDSEFHVRKGPLFANVILADEINRAPAKVHSALLEAMEENTVSIGGHTLPLPEPFVVLATQNPIEQEATYRLPEAQLDRFMFKIKVDYPTEEDELTVLNRQLSGGSTDVSPVVSVRELVELQDVIGQVRIDDRVRRYILRLVQATRPSEVSAVDALAGLVEYGASPRASSFLASGAQAVALIDGRDYVIPEDVKELAKPVLRHRIILTYRAQAEEVYTDDIIGELLQQISVP